MSFGYVPDFQGKSRLKNLYLRMFGYPYAPRRNEARLVFNRLRPNMGTKVLDVGCGDGVWTNDLAQKGWEITGLDISEEDVGTARSRARQMGSNCEMVVGDAQKMPFEDKLYDQCFSICVLEHIPDDDRVFHEVSRVLKPGGTFILSVPTSRLPWPMKAAAKLPRPLKRLFASELVLRSGNSEELKENTDKRFVHWRRYDEEMLRAKAEKAGFSIEHTGYNLKFFGDMINGLIHSLKVFEFEKTGEYKFKSAALHAAVFPLFYLFHRLDDAIPVGGCTIVAELRKN